MSDEVFCTALQSMLARFDATARRLALRAQSVSELDAWRHELRAELRRAIGLDTGQRVAPSPRVTERSQLDGYWRERVELATEPGVVMPLYVLVPAGLQPGEVRPAVIALHGHGGGGKLATAGRRDIPAVAEAIAQYNYDYGVQLVRRGFVVFCPDARGFGERRELGRQGEGDLLGKSCDLLNHMALPLGRTALGMWTWDNMRLLDYIQARPECDSRRIGCAGLSGGGLQALFLAALDERVQAAVISGYFYGYKDALLRLNSNCSCNYVPGLWLLADMGDIGALIAPRPLLIETGSEDPLNGERGAVNAEEQVAIARRAYRLLGAEERLEHDIFAGGHRWHGVRALPFLARHLDQACPPTELHPQEH